MGHHDAGSFPLRPEEVEPGKPIGGEKGEGGREKREEESLRVSGFRAFSDLRFYAVETLVGFWIESFLAL